MVISVEIDDYSKSIFLKVISQALAEKHVSEAQVFLEYTENWQILYILISYVNNDTISVMLYFVSV